MKRKTVKVITVSLMASILLNGCLGVGPTPDEIEANNHARNMFLKALSQRMNQNNQTVQQPVKKINQPINILSESQLKEKIDSFEKISTGVKFTKYKDGFSINGNSRFLDPEGRIIKYGYNWETGDVTYIIETMIDKFKIKYMRALTNQAPILIANASRNQGILNIQTVTGKNFNSEGLVLTSKGFIALREESAFFYKIGENTKTFITPKGWHIAKFQNGDVASTNYILLEKNIVEDKKGNELASVINTGKSLMSSLGIIEKKDYMLVNLDNPKLFQLFNIDTSDKQVQIYSQCRNDGSFINKCDNMDSVVSLYKPDGSINNGHYYWRIMWYKTKDKTIAVAMEANFKKITITDLETGKKVEAAYRLTGFPGIESSQDATGNVKVSALGGVFSDVQVDNAEEFLKKEKDIRKKNEDK